jgi:DNA-binding response OmpR family regulator
MPKVVVIVDDSDSIASSLAIALESSLDVRAIVAHHPRAALGLFERETDISVIVTDLNLPFLNGFNLIGELRKLRSYQGLPALMITGEENPDAFRTTGDCQPNVIMRKPFSYKEVCRVVESLLR